MLHLSFHWVFLKLVSISNKVSRRKQNVSTDFGFIAQNWILGELFILHKEVIGIKEKVGQDIEVPVSLIELLLQIQWTFVGIFFICLFEILHFMMAFRGIGLSKPFHLIFGW